MGRDYGAYKLTRRQALQAGIAASGLMMLGGEAGAATPKRRFHVSMSVEALSRDPELLDVVARAGASEVWLAAFFYGHWPWPMETLRRWRQEAERRGLGVSFINVPLGHPGDALGSSEAGFPLAPPKHWRLAVRPDGSTYAGTSLHPPATEENVAALKRLREQGAKRVFVDDDFRLAVGPGVIGGCFCDDHRRQFLQRGGYPEKRWDELLADVRGRSLTPLLRDWVEFTCDQLTSSFRAQERAIGGRGHLGIMVMYLGAEKAGIRLKDYAGALFRVGELMFDDGSFGTVKGKTDELFSALFHRRFVRPELAFSETTAFPPSSLSAKNIAAKLIVSTISDVRNTMFMGGVAPFPKSHWDVLGPAMKRQAALHELLGGHKPYGPLKLYWGEAARYVGDDRPFSLPLALGIPFEVVDKPAPDGWTFLCDADLVMAAAGRLQSAGSVLLGRQAGRGKVQQVAEDPSALAAWKASVLPKLQGVPHLADEGHAVLAWYPTARKALIWNLEEAPRECVLNAAGQRRIVRLEALGAEIVDAPDREGRTR